MSADNVENTNKNISNTETPNRRRPGGLAQPSGTPQSKGIGRKNVQIVKHPQDLIRERFVIYLDNRNATPKPLNPLTYERGKERQISLFDIGSGVRTKSADDLDVHTSNVLYNEFRQGSKKSLTMQGNMAESRIAIDAHQTPAAPPDATAVIEVGVIPRRAEEDKIPEYISIVLKETSTDYILEMPSKTVDRDTDEGVETEETNKRYEYLTVGKGRNRKVLSAEVQTVPVLYKTRETEKDQIKNESNYAFASGWDMFDTYAQREEVAQRQEQEEVKAEFVLEQKKSCDSVAHTKEECEFRRIAKSSQFFEACIVIERLLANNNFNKQQKRFRGLIDPEPFRDGIEYKYRLDRLWTFANDKTEGRCVTGFSWNCENKDILAVGYGKFFFATETTGMVMIWNIKNPVQPERTFNFHDPVTCLSFSMKNPHLLAIGFYYGSVKIIDITSTTTVRIIGQNSKENYWTHEAIWQVIWVSDDEYYKGFEQLIALAQDGRIYKFRHTDSLHLLHSQIMRISSEGELKGIKLIRKCNVPGLPLTNFPGALVYAKHPIDPNIYFIGAGNGIVHKCSKNFFHQHLDSYKAHDGPVKQAKFSPFCNKLLLTCGDDWYTRVWLDSVWEPLVELRTNIQTTEGADWSPSHSTIIATIGGNEIYIWDLQRKSYSPQSTLKSPTNSRNTIVRFTDDGRCLAVGDIDGNVHVFVLEDMPFPAFFQSNLLVQSLKRALIIKPDLMRLFKKQGNLNFTTTETNEN